MNALKSKLEKTNDEHILISLSPVLADALEVIGERKEAIRFLEESARRTSAPWYFYSHIGYFFKEAGQINESLAWYERAMNDAKGSATKIQWISSYLKVLDKSTVPDRTVRMELALTDLFSRGIQVNDSFNGRNKRAFVSAVKITESLADLSPKFVKFIASIEKKCAKVKLDPGICAEYYGSLTKKAASLNAKAM